MNKKEISIIACSKVINSNKIDKCQLETASFCGRSTKYKNGLYFLYNQNDEVVYIGMIGDAQNTSLYDRMIGHGTGAHSQEVWYQNIAYGKFYRFDLDEKNLKTIERLAISEMGQPIYNDGLSLEQKSIDELSRCINV